jgi:hypothetical protein
MKKGFQFFIFLSFFYRISAQDSLLEGNFLPPESPLSIYAVKTNSAIKLDGKLIEAVWSQAPAYTPFIQVEPNQGQQAKYQTVVTITFLQLF